MYNTDLWNKGWLQKISDVYMLKTFMPFPLKENNCYLVEGDSGWIVIDTGVNSEQNRSIFTSAMAAIGINWRQIAAIYVTHYHQDHTGLAGWLQQMSDAVIYLPEPDILTFNTFMIGDGYLDNTIEALMSAAWPKELAVDLAGDIKQIKNFVKPLPTITPLPADGFFTWAGSTYRCIPVPGHTDGHCVFYSSQNKNLFSGDNILADVNLHLTDWPHGRITNPCDAHLSVLQQIKQLPVNIVLPGHGKVFANLNERIDQIVAHHSSRKELVYQALQKPITAWELAQIVFKPNSYIHIKRLSLAETLAYLESLINEGRVECDLVGGKYVYRRSKTS